LSFTVAVLQLAVAVAAVVVALLVARHNDGPSKGTSRTTSTRSPSTHSQAASAASPGVGVRPAKRSEPATDSRAVVRPRDTTPTPIVTGGSGGAPHALGTSWPVGFAGYTVALASDVIRSDAVGALAKARSAGLSSVGVLRSDRYASLRPGYWFVFSGVYATVAQARLEVSAAVGAGFSDAYVRRVAE
jgi:eukaryotic-like serine/threonine-protein kinase